MIKLTYPGGTPIWIIPQNIGSLEELDDDSGSLIVLINGREFSVKEKADKICNLINKWWNDPFQEDD